MKLYTVAATEHDLRHGGTEIMASSFDEARDKAEALGVPCHVRKCFTSRGDAYGEGFYAVSDGAEVCEMGCEYIFETIVDAIGEEVPELL